MTLASIEAALRAAFPLGGPHARATFVGLVAEDAGVWARLDLTLGGRSFPDARVYLLGSAEVDDGRADPFVTGWAAALDELFARAIATTAQRLAPVWLDVRMPMGALGRGADASAYRDKLLRTPWLGAVLHRPEAPDPFEPAPEEVVIVGGQLDLRRLNAWLERHAQRTFTDTDWDRALLASMPKPARHVWALHDLASEVLHNGLVSFVIQSDGPRIRLAIEALDAAGAVRLHALTSTTIGLALNSSPEFLQEPRARWWRSLAPPRPGASLSDVDGHADGRSFHLVETELPERARAYAERHRARLVRAAD